MPQGETELKHEGGFPTSDRASDSHRECAPLIISIQGRLAFMKMARMLHRLVGVTSGTVVMIVMVIVGMRVRVRRHKKRGLDGASDSALEKTGV